MKKKHIFLPPQLEQRISWELEFRWTPMSQQRRTPEPVIQQESWDEMTHGNNRSLNLCLSASWNQFNTKKRQKKRNGVRRQFRIGIQNQGMRNQNPQKEGIRGRVADYDLEDAWEDEPKPGNIPKKTAPEYEEEDRY